MQQDVKTAADHGVWPHVALTGVTAQTFQGVVARESTGIGIFRSQLSCVQNVQLKAIKIGAVFSLDILEAVCEFINSYEANKKPFVVYDPVFSPTRGESFYDEKMIDFIKDKLIPAVDLITPNRGELEIVCDKELADLKSAVSISSKLRIRYPDTRFYLKGGHYENHDHTIIAEALVHHRVEYVRKKKSVLKYNHGTGCMFSTAVACGVANGRDVLEACVQASHYVSKKYEYINKKMGID